MKVPFVDLSREFKILRKDLIKTFDEVGKSGQYIRGERLEKFENKISKIIGCKYVLGVSNWTEGALMIFKSLSIGKNDEVITVSHSFVATCGAIIAAQAKPVFVDINEDLLMDVNLIEKAITKKTKAIMPVHLSGIPCQMDKINTIAKKYNLYVIEDAAQAFGSKYNKKMVGNLGHIGCFSMHPLKNLGVYGDGGFVTTNNKKIYEKIKLLRHHGLKTRNEARIWGYNGKLDELQAAFANIKLTHIKKWKKKHQDIARFYNSKLSINILKPDKKYIENTFFHNYIIRVKDRSNLIKFLKNNNVETAIHYPIPIHRQEAYTKMFKQKKKLKITEKISKEILSLPIYHALKKRELEKVVNTINKYYSKK